MNHPLEKTCCGCDSRVFAFWHICPKCHSYRFDEIEDEQAAQEQPDEWHSEQLATLKKILFTVP